MLFKYENYDYEFELLDIKGQIDDYVKESSATACTNILKSSYSSPSTIAVNINNENDIQMMTESYRHCFQKYLEFRNRLHKEKSNVYCSTFVYIINSKHAIFFFVDEELDAYNKTSQVEIRLKILIENYKSFVQINKLVNNEEHIENLIRNFLVSIPNSLLIFNKLSFFSYSSSLTLNT